MEVDDYLADSVGVDDFLLDEEFRRVAADQAYWNARYAAALKAHLLARLDAKRARARVWAEQREALAGTKHTVSDIEAAVDQDERWLGAARAEIEAESERALMRGYAEAVGTKRDALQSLGAKLRKEMEGDLRVARQHSDARRIDRGEDDL
jgi:hypothetical protein